MMLLKIVAPLILISLLGVIPYCCPSPFSRVFCITPTNGTMLEIFDNEEYFEYNCSSNFTLEYVLQNYTKFFTSNTEIKLLPGTHEVNESVGNVVVRDIENFSITGTACNMDKNDTILQSCSKIECNGNSLLGIAFMNATNITISKLNVSNCRSVTVQLQKNYEDLYNDTCENIFFFLPNFRCLRDNPDINSRLSAFSDAHSACDWYTFLFAQSSSVTVEQMSIEHLVGACIVAIGVTRFQLYDSFLNIRSSITALDNSNTHRFKKWQTYNLKNLVVMAMASHKNVSSGKNSVDIKVQFYNIQDRVRVTFVNVTLKYGNLTLTYKNKHCNKGFRTDIILKNFALLGNDKSCYALVLDKSSVEKRCYQSWQHIHTRNVIFLQSCQFTQSSIAINREAFVYESTKLKLFREVVQDTYSTSLILTLKQVHIESVPCNCMAAIYVSSIKANIESLTVTNSCCSGEALVWFNRARVKLTGSNRFVKNKGTCISCTHGVLDISGHNSISDNIAERYNGSIFVTVNSTIFTANSKQTELEFRNNTGKQCGGIMARKNSKLKIGDSTTLRFINNSGFDGGALALYDHSVLNYHFKEITRDMRIHIEFVGNLALNYGGAIYIEDEGYLAMSSHQQIIDCALHPNSKSKAPSFMQRIVIRNNTITFAKNAAMNSGSTLYGGWIDVCDNKIINDDPDTANYYYYGIRIIAADPNDLSVISSNPSRVCVCIDSTPQCNITDYEMDPLYPGQSFQIEAVAVGQRFGITPSTVSAAFVNSSVKIDQLQSIQIVSKICTYLKYTIKSANRRENLILTVNTKNVPTLPDHDRSWGQMLTQEDLKQLAVTLLFQQLNITIPLLMCPLGYLFDYSSNTCVCNKELQKHNAQCDLVNYAVLRSKNQWINATFEHIDNTMNHGVLVHNHCPLDYCISTDQSLKLETPSDQCNFKRSGILCGKCQGNLSLIFGTNRCKKCSSMWALLVIPVFILLGLALVALIIILNLTVAQGTVNALIFYANIVSANQATFFPTETIDTFFKWFIAWLNLDVGIKTCFISGLDAYTKTWLQFLFPIYIWLLVILIIMASRYSTLAARLSGENAVPALATLFLLSYTKLLRITITAFSSTQLEYPDGYIRRVWLYDGNVDFFEPKHAILFVAALLLLLIISAPYTLVLFTIQWLQRLPYHCLLSWVWKLKPLFDAHTGPYKEKHRYWPGLLLLVRAVLFVAFSMNVKNDPAFNLLITLITTTCLFAYLAYLGGVHKATYLDILEYIFLLNLSILSAATFYTRLSDGNQNSIIKTSVCTAFIITLAIVLTHIYQKVNSTAKGEKCFKLISTVTSKSCTPLLSSVSCLSRFGVTKSSNSCTGNRNTSSNTNATQYHTHASIELRESLLVQQD